MRFKWIVSILTICFLLLVSLAEARFPRGNFISNLPPSGNINLNLSGHFYFTGHYPFINVLKTASQISVNNDAVPGVTYVSATPQGAVDLFGNPSAFATYLDNDGDLLSSLPTGNITYSRIVFDLATGTPPSFANAAMTIDWSSGAAGWTVLVTSSVGTLATGTGTTPLTFNWPSAATQVTLLVFGTGANPPKQFRMYKTAYQSQLNAGKYADPQYVTTVLTPGSNMLRLGPSWMNTNGDLISTSISNMPSVNNAGWTGGGNGWNTVNNNTNGTPLTVLSAVSNEANKHPWVTIPEGFTTPKMREIYSISRSSTPVVTTYGPHSFSNGDTVIIGTWSPFSGPLLLNPSSYSAGTFTTSGVNSIANDTPVVLGKLLDGSNDGSTYPTGITKGTVYWTIAATSTTFQLSATPGGSALSLSGSMTGTINVTENYQQGSTYGQLKLLTSYSSSTWTLNNHGLVDSTPIIFGVSAAFPLNGNVVDSSTYPTGITKLLTVYVKNATANTFQTSLTPGGTAMTLSGSMVGTPSIYLKLAGNRFTVANSNPSGNTFELTGPGANTAGYNGQSRRAIFSGPGGVFAGVALMPFNLSTIDTVVGDLVTNVRANQAVNQIPRYELSNEIWNFQATFTAYYNVGSSQIPNSTLYQNSQYFMHGYLQAAVAHSVYKSYGAANRSKYKMILSGNQTGNDILGGAGGVAAGVLQYLTDNGGGLTVTDLFNHLSVTSYIGGQSYSQNGSPVTVTFGTNTITFSGPIARSYSAAVGMPIKLNTNSPGGTLPTGITAGTLSNGTYPSGSGQIYWLVGSSPNFGLAITPGGSAVSFSGGSGSNTATAAPEDVIQYLMAQSISLNGSNPALYPNQWTFFDTSIGEDVYNGKWTAAGINTDNGPFFGTILWCIGRYDYFNTNYTAIGMPLAGLTLIGYEGGNSNSPTAGGGFLMINDATWQSAYSYQEYGDGTATNLTQLYNGSVLAGKITNLSQFVDVSTLSINYGYGDFGAWRYVGDVNARQQGIVTINSLN